MVNYNTNEQVYNAKGDKSTASQIVFVICALVQRGLYIAGFSASKELLTIQYTGYNKNKPVWEIDFFEHIFNTDPILAKKDRVVGVFIGSDKNLIVPDELYDEDSAATWLSRIHFIETNDVIYTYPLADEKATYLLAAPVSITELVKINFQHAEVLPLAIYQFRGIHASGYQLQLCLSGEQVCITLHNSGQLLWHRVFGHTSAEEIAYVINNYCLENKIDPAQLNLACTGISATEFDRMNELTQYFPGLKAGDGSSISMIWDGAISLAQQLLACVS
jgi:hypothetical protein